MSITVKKSPSFSGTGGLRFTGNSSTTLLAAKQSSVIPWTPAAIPGCILHLGSYAESRATRATQPTPDDWDMERADTTRWVPNGSCTVSKEISDPSPAGGQWLKVTRSAVDYYIQQWNVAITGNRYRLRGWMKTSGCNGVYFAPGVAIPGSASWVAVNDEQTWGGTYFYLGCNGGVAGAWSGWDGIQLENLSVTAYTPAFTTISGAALGQSSAAYMPWIDQTVGALRFDGTADNISLSGALSSWKCLHDGTGVTVLIALKRTTSGDYILSTDNAINTNVGVSLLRASDPGTVELRVHNGSGTPVCTVTQTGLTINTPHVLEYSLSTADGAEITVDGVSNASGLTGSCSWSNPTYAPMFMARQDGGWMAGYLYDILVIARRLAPTDPERVAARRYMAALCGAVIP